MARVVCSKIFLGKLFALRPFSSLAAGTLSLENRAAAKSVEQPKPAPVRQPLSEKSHAGASSSKAPSSQGESFDQTASSSRASEWWSLNRGAAAHSYEEGSEKAVVYDREALYNEHRRRGVASCGDPPAVARPKYFSAADSEACRRQSRSAQQLPFFIRRTASDNVPVYLHWSNNRSKVSTIIRKVHGRKQILKAELAVLCEAPVIEKEGWLEVRGNHKRVIKETCGFHHDFASTFPNTYVSTYILAPFRPHISSSANSLRARRIFNGNPQQCPASRGLG
ncbi:putative large subunit ribosomal protein [Besnoitia besnoiti]|uniref:Large ribosomal subunit protein mL49 n=1 Tax=Besnoitia besnoiti TaxID=94643 RepID=A0A2A9MIS5_BESBE|nr:putative large subunit ribosomal protein [Besnoitia besnoiti]PFH35543.1 putative large subunit ribosomal protein [Besnoitia besnoiti]